MALMARETRVREGRVGSTLGGVTLRNDHWMLCGDEFLMRAEGGIGLRYRRGEGITLERPAGADPRTVALWLKGTVHAAVAALNGFFPLHASAVAHDGRAYAFTGPAGAGKSTLVAALGRAGFSQLCDDTLILDLSGDGAPRGLPGHTRLKLWPEGAALAGVEPGELVAGDYPKHFVDPAGGIITEPLPLAGLFYLEPGETPKIAPLSGGERIERLQDDHYTGELWRQASGLSREERFAALASLARRIDMRRFVRPFDPARFVAGVDAAAAFIRSAPE
jgi:hypothetical protein